MWTKPPPTITATARPLRVAYLIDRDGCAGHVLAAIFRECYGRWGGRRTLIVPAKSDGIDKEYVDWLWHYDPDIIYSFVALSEDAIARIHEKYCPTHLKIDSSAARPEQAADLWRVELPIQGLGSLSLVTALLNRRNMLTGKISDLKIIDKYYDRSESQFLEENFGFVLGSYQTNVSRLYPELFGSLALISEETLADPRMGKDPAAQYVTTEVALLEELAKDRPIWTLSLASDFLTPYLALPHGEWSDGVTLVIGDSVDDRLLYWNQHQWRDEDWQSAISCLRISLAKLADPDFIAVLQRLLLRRALRSSGHPIITLKSCSVPTDKLSELAEILRKPGFWPTILVRPQLALNACIPKFDRHHAPYHRYSTIHSGLRNSESTEFSGDRVHVPRSLPWHLREALPPQELRRGCWMIALDISRINDNNRATNVRESWTFPRRLHLEKAITISWPEDVQGYYKQVTRVARYGSLAIPAEYGAPSVSLKLPDDISAFRRALCLEREWNVADHSQTMFGRQRYAYAQISDKGRYLIEVLQHFENLSEAFGILMHTFWRDALMSLGAVPVEKNEALRAELIVTLRKRLGQRGGPLRFENDVQLDRLASEAIRYGRKAGTSERTTNYKAFFDKWSALVSAEMKETPHLSEDDRAHYEDPERLNHALQLVCRRKLFFQGRDWTCRRCFNKNWTSIDDLRSVLLCEVCKEETSAPVSGEWDFKPNSFIVSSYREHGIEPVIWTLWRLWNNARSSFYFAPSLNLWETYPEGRQAQEDVEVDALAVVDGALYLCEAKTSAGLSAQQIAQLISAAERIRPDVILISCTDKISSGMKAAASQIQTTVGDEIKVELLELTPEMLETNSSQIS
ncbi:hypothetical protein V1294_000961 [Bradyrhizobium sp. AZCC 1678]|uniref:hypothetical protein n=1 Tax=Bradyrhizobium sp. AZCC 1678 TaxID=3117030 RepID=UPI002FF39D1A